MNSAMTLEEVGNVDNALVSYHSALEVYPGYLPAVQGIARATVRSRREDGELPGGWRTSRCEAEIRAGGTGTDGRWPNVSFPAARSPLPEQMYSGAVGAEKAGSSRYWAHPTFPLVEPTRGVTHSGLDDSRVLHPDGEKGSRHEDRRSTCFGVQPGRVRAIHDVSRDADGESERGTTR